MSSRGTGLTLMLGIVAGFVGYVLWTLAIGMDTKVDDIETILKNSASGSGSITISMILVSIGLVVHGAGLMSTRGTAAGTWESLGIVSIIAAIIIWITSSALGIALVEMGEKFVSAATGGLAAKAAAEAAAAAAQAAAAAGDAATAAAAGAQATEAGAIAMQAATDARSIAVAGGFTQAANAASGAVGQLLAGIGWLALGMAYRSSDAKGAINIPLGLHALIIGLILVVSQVGASIDVWSIETGNSVGGIGFLLIVLWSVNRGMALINAK